MAVKTFKPTTPSRRHMSVSSFAEVTTDKPEKSLLRALKKKSGRNNQGRITVRHRGGGHKRAYRVIDFLRTDKLDIPGKVASVEYDPNRTCYIMLVNYVDGEKRYHIAPEGIQVGDEILTKKKGRIKPGQRMLITSIPLGQPIHDVELTPGKGGQIIRSAGSAGKVSSLEGKYAQIQLPSGEVRLISKECYATIGVVSNTDHSNIKIGKAGRKRWLGRKPQVRGKVMNPVDHPHGGGEGSNSIGLKYPKTPWGMPALGLKTRKRKKISNKFIVRDRRRKK